MSKAMGRVDLIGAGCGRADLITLRGLQLLERCDTVVYDDLIDPALLELSPAQAERIYMGKRRGRHSAAQEEICQTLIDLARAGKRVARLKGGDPFVFGRGGEEALALRAAGIPFSQVPGISSAIAIPAEAGIPVTHRGLSQSVHIVTGHTVHTDDGLPADLDKLAGLEGTLIFLMGLSKLEALANRLMAAGKGPDTPAAVISGGCAPHPAAIRGTLADIAAQATRIAPPAVILVGEVAGLELYPPRPLQGVRVGLTGTPSITRKLTALLEEQGAEARLVCPTAVEELPSPDWAHILGGPPRWLAFTSANGVDIFFQKLLQERIDLRRLRSCKLAVIGQATGEALARHGLIADLCPEVFTGEALAHALCQTVVPGEEVFLLRSALGSRLLPDILTAHSVPVHDTPLYTVRAVPTAAPPQADYLLFASAGGITQFLSAHGSIPADVRCVCIGPVAAQELAQHWNGPILVARQASAQALVEAVCQDVQLS